MADTKDKLTDRDSPKRTEQINVRLTADEKKSWTTAAKEQGFRGLPDFLRVITLRRAQKVSK